MQAVLIFLMSTLLTIRSSLCLKHLEEPRWKSFEDAKLECAEYLFITNQTLQRYATFNYPDEPSVRKMLVCIILGLKAWDEDQQQIKDYVFKQFFLPSTVDCQYELHKQQCLEQTVSPLDEADRLGRSYNSFLCYYRNSAGISDELGWVPYVDSEIQQVLVDAMRFVPHSRESLVEYCQGNLLTPPEHLDLAYAVTVRLGFYSSTAGVDFGKVLIQFGNPDVSDAETKDCVVGVIEQYCKQSDLVVNAILQCFAKYIPVIEFVSRAASTVLGNPPECGLPPKETPKTQPCYNGLC